MADENKKNMNRDQDFNKQGGQSFGNQNRQGNISGQENTDQNKKKNNW